ncbi:MAG: DUF6273 domain-containing protein [Clostridiales bacterium]|nr:DUF6273 domain-containing protein [Clostridiales bacterium]
MALFGGLFGKKGYDPDVLRNASVGQEVKFGLFPQDAKGTKLSPVSWQVIDKKDGRVLLISKEGLLCMQFFPRLAKWDETIAWEKSSLRGWLNGEFVEKCFSPEEKAVIAETDVPADPNPTHTKINPGNATKDKVFLLSVLEAKKYFPTKDSRKCPRTRFAASLGAWTSDGPDTGNACWWLRTPGYSQSRAAYVGTDGELLDGGVDIDDSTTCCIRPAIWVNVN